MVEAPSIPTSTDHHYHRTFCQNQNISHKYHISSIKSIMVDLPVSETPSFQNKCWGNQPSTTMNDVHRASVREPPRIPKKPPPFLAPWAWLYVVLMILGHKFGTLGGDERLDMVEKTHSTNFYDTSPQIWSSLKHFTHACLKIFILFLPHTFTTLDIESESKHPSPNL